MALLAAALTLVLAACGGNEAPAGVCTGEGTDPVVEGRLTVGADMSFAPFAFYDPQTREPDGFEVQLLSAAAERLSLELQIVERASPGLVPGLLAGRFDVAASGLKTLETEEHACLVSPHLSGDLGVLVQTGQTEHIDGPGDLGPLRVGAVMGTAGAAWVREELGDGPGERRSFPIDDDAVATLIAGHIDALILDVPQAARRQQLHPEVTLVETIDTADAFSFALHPDQGGLRDELDRALEEMRADGTYERLVEHWFADDRVVE